MLLCDSEIKELINAGILRDADPERVGPVSYDLRTKSFAADEGETRQACELMPGDSVFVVSEEIVHLPDELAARVLLKNSRIRQGLTLDAPLYFPGHETRLFFRVTNVSGDAIALDTTKGIAQLTFERLDCKAEQPYRGAFSDEMTFTGMGRYRDVYASEMRKVERKVDQVKGIEKRIYGNVMAIMAIFAAIFTLVNVNMGSLSGDLRSLLVANLATVGSFAVLVALVGCVLGTRKRLAVVAPLAIAAMCFAAAAACLLLVV